MLVTEDENGILTAYERDYLGGTNRSEAKYELTMIDGDAKIVVGHMGRRQLLRENILSDYEIYLFTSDFNESVRRAIIQRLSSKQQTTFIYGKWQIVGFVADLDQSANFLVGIDHPNQFVRFHVRGMTKQLALA